VSSGYCFEDILGYIHLGINMVKYIIKRILMMIPIILGIAFIIFSILYLTPGDPAREILGPDASQERVDLLREEMGLNDGLLVQFGRYVWKGLHGDFGTSYQTGQKVLDILVARIPVTVTLAIGATVIAILIGIPLGIISAIKQYSVVDSFSMFMAMVFSSLPNFWLGILLMMLFALKLHLFPAAGNASLKAFVLPWLTLGAHTIATLTRMTRSSMLEVIRQDYIRTARGKGAKEGRVVFRHALKNSLLPVITVIGSQLSMKLGGSIVIESVFSLSGIGSMVSMGIKSKDTPVVMMAVFAIAIFGCLTNLIVDLVFFAIDPRIKGKLISGKKKRKAA